MVILVAARLCHLLLQHGVLLPLQECGHIQQRRAFTVCREHSRFLAMWPFETLPPLPHICLHDFDWKRHSTWQHCTLRRNAYIEAAVLTRGVVPWCLPWRSNSAKDAGVISFAVGSMVDRSRSVGFQSASGNLICVAPVVDVSMRPGSPANLFAYGMNCCKHRGSFNCDDAGNPAARYGMVLPEPADILPPLLRDAFPGPSAEDLEAAVRLQQASFGRSMQTQSRHTFVQYMADPLRVEMAHVDTAMLTALGCSLLYLAMLTLAVSSIVLGNGTIGSFFRRLVL